MDYTNLITIAIPCYERKEYFRMALESAINQTVKCEIIVVDNCSSHDFFEKACNEKGIKYFRNESNIGLYPNIDRCFELANTEYVKILDDDDLLSPLYVESFLKALSNYPDLDIYFSNYVMISSKGEFDHSYKLPFCYMQRGDKIIEYGIQYSLGFPYMSCTFKKSKMHNSFEKQDKRGGYDWLWIYSNADKFSFYGDIQKLYIWRVHDNQTHNKDWITFRIATPFIYDRILQEKIFNNDLRKKAADKANQSLIYIKSCSKKGEIISFLDNQDCFSEYLKAKLQNNLTLRIIYKTPSFVAGGIFFIFKIKNRIKNHKLSRIEK